MDALLRVNDVTKILGGRDILRRVSLSCAPGEVVLIVGENGVGKSTLLRVMTGIIEPDHGEIHVAGHLLNDGGLKARRALGYVPDTSDALPDLTVSEFLSLTAALKGVDIGRRGGRPDITAKLRERLGIHVVSRQRLSTLSFGQRKRACVLAALIGDPALLVLDEPSNGLDPEGAAVVRGIIEERRGEGKAAVLTTNDRAFAASLCATRYELRSARLHPVSSASE